MTRVERKKLTKENDRLCSELVRRRDFKKHKACVRCGHSKSSWKELQWAHLISRNYLKTRWNPDAGVGICGGCHLYIDNVRPDAKKELAIKLLGAEKLELLLDAAQRTGGKVDYMGWNLWLKVELALVSQARLSVNL